MEFLKSVALSQGIEHYHLLVFMAAVCSMVFIPYVLYVFGSSAVSLWYVYRSKMSVDLQSFQIARFVISDAFPSKNTAFFLGIIPGFSLVLIYAQMLQLSPSISVSLTTAGFVFLVVGLVLLSNFRHLIGLQGIFSAFQSLLNDEQSKQLDRNILHECEATVQPIIRLGKYGVISLFIAICLYLTSLSLVGDPEHWGSVESVFDVLLTSGVWLKFAAYFAFSLGVTGIGILYFSQLRSASILDSTLHKIVNIFLTIAFIVVPVVLYLVLVTTPTTGISGSVFFVSGIALVLMFISANFVYQYFKEKKFKMISFGALAFLLGAQFMLISDHVRIGTATRAHAQILSLADDKVLEALNNEVGVAPVAMTGEEIYQVKCSSCHLFSKKKVGPAYDTVLKKYVGQKALMMAFIMNPTKVNPEYPPMPGQGLKLAEADSIATYLLNKMEDTRSKK